MALLPTPSTSEATGTGHAAQGGMNLRQTRRTPSQEAGTHGKCLAAEVAGLLPTPTVADADRTSTTYGRGNPTLPGAAVNVWTGASTAPRSSGGNTPSDGPHHGQLTLWDA